MQARRYRFCDTRRLARLSAVGGYGALFILRLDKSAGNTIDKAVLPAGAVCRVFGRSVRRAAPFVMMDMKKIAMLAMSLLAMSCAGTPSAPVESAAEVQNAQPALALSAHPDNRAGDAFDELWGEKVPDPYRWLEDVSDPEVKAWMKAQDSRAREYLSQLPTRSGYEARLSELLYVPSISTPLVRGKLAFYFERGARDEKSLLYVRDLSEPDSAKRLLLDPNQLSPDGSVSIGDIYPSWDGKLMAYTLKANNADQAVVHVMDVATGKDLPDILESGRYADPQWLADGSGFYYTHFPLDESIPVDERPGMTDVRFHRMGTAEAEDAVIVAPLKDATKFHYPMISKDGNWLIYSIQDGWNGNSLKVMHRASAGAEWLELPVKPSTTYEPMIVDNVLYLMTNDGASRYRIVKIDLGSDKIRANAAVPWPEVAAEYSGRLDVSNWQEIVPEFEDRVIQNYTVIGGKLFVMTLKDVVNQLEVYDTSGKLLKSVALPDKGSIISLSGSDDAEALYFKFTSYRIPANVYRVDAASLEVSVWAEISTPAKIDDVVSEQRFAVSKDGTKVPYFVLRRKDAKLDGTARTMIYGYGGFNVAITPSFNPAAYAWVENGGIYVYSVLRGGSEYGETWHQAGMGMHKQNVFDDYYAVAEDLIANNYTRRESVAAYGGSNGGLLTGAALTQRPDLYGAILCAVPLLDMLRYQKYGSGRTWIGEYGNAEASEAEYRNIRAYSPYANVRDEKYPAVLFLGADSDDRVDPMHARKMTAAIQDHTTNAEAPVLLRIEKNSGHGGADLTSQRIAQFADMFAFLDVVLK